MPMDPVQLLIDAGAIPSSPFGPSSRYHGVALGRCAKAGGAVYVLRRFIPRPGEVAIGAEHVVKSGERPDLLAGETLGDPELYWRLADANAVIDPLELTDTLGRRVAIPLPSGP